MSGGQQVNVYRELKMHPGAIVTGALGPLFDTGGTTYYVNNITGSTTADGLSWNSAVSEVSRAITLSEASRLIHPGGSTNDYVMNTIVVQGTGTAYSSISALPSYARVIGLGADSFGNGAGIARLTSSSGNTAAGSTRGSSWHNMQFNGSGSGYAMDLAVIFRASFEHCLFGNKSTGAMRIVTGGGVIIDDCLFGGDTIETAYGLFIGSDSGSSGNFNSCKVSNSTFHGTTAACYNSAYYQNQTVFTNNVFQGGTYGLQDNTQHSGGVQYNAWYVNNFGYGTYSTTLNEAGIRINILPYDRSIGNLANDHGTVHWHPAIA